MTTTTLTAELETQTDHSQFEGEDVDEGEEDTIGETPVAGQFCLCCYGSYLSKSVISTFI